MYKLNSFITRYCLAAAVMLALLGPMVQKGLGSNFSLLDNMQMTVSSPYDDGMLTDSSHASIVSGGGVYHVLNAGGSSSVDMSGGWVTEFWAHGNSTMSMSGGSVGDLIVYESSSVDLFGGNVVRLQAVESGIVTFHGQNFLTSGNMAIIDNRVAGTGTLSGNWMDGTPWSVNIVDNYLPTATILVVPEPATLLLFGLGAVIIRRRQTS